MKNLLSLFILLAFLPVYGQDTVKKDSAWKAGGLLSLTMAQANFSNWAAGGENSYSANGRAGIFANYTRNMIAWENNLDMAYGISKQGTSTMRKTDDIFEINSKLGYKASEKWFYTAVFNARSQFDKGYQYSTVDSVEDLVISEPFAPLYLNLAIGMDYKPNQYASLFLSPLNMKNIYVYDTKYALRYSIDSAQNMRTDVGAIIKFKYERKLIENVDFLTKLDVFANYLELKEIKDVDVNWEILINLKVWKALAVNLNTNLIWDKDVKYIESDGSAGNARVQFKEVFGAGLAYKF
ncbi:MAG: DUF3078 domain-containing protein [Bacteroidota bacterium]|nr:MAG: DUF3078 domain-containing protein [Bacteroidota bacterium]